MPILLKPSRPSLPPEMLLTFAMAMVSFVLLFVALVRIRYRLAVAAEALEDAEVPTPAPVTDFHPEPLR